MAWRTFWFALWIALVCAIAGIVFVKYAKAADESVFIIVARFSLLGYSGEVLPDGKRHAFADLVECRKAIPAVERSFARRALPASPDSITCQKLEIKR